LTCPDFAEALQARLLAKREADRRSLRRLSGSDERGRVKALKAHIATLEDAVANTEALGEQQRQEAGTAAKRVEAMEAHISTLEGAVTTARHEAETAARRLEALEAQIAKLENVVANAEAIGERRCQEAEIAVKRVEALEAHIAQAAIGIKLAIMMGDGHITGFNVERLRGIAEFVAGPRTAS
jgi:chromosome segregation ATPase